MKRKTARGAILVWALLSPVSFIILMFASFGYHTNSLPWAFFWAFFAIVSILVSIIAVVEFTRSERWFQSEAELEEELEATRKARRLYINKLVELELKK